MEATIFTGIGETVEAASTAFLLPAIDRIIDAIQGLALVGTTLYIWLLGAAIVFGQAKPTELFGKALKVVVVTAIALSADNYGAYIVDGFTGLESGLAEVLGTGTDGTTIYGTLDGALSQGIEVANLAFRLADEAGWNLGSAFLWIIAGSVIAVGTVIVGLLGGATIIMAKFTLAILFALGPFFVLLLIWPITARYFDGWMASVFNYTLVVIIVATIMSFSVAAFGTAIGGADLTGDGKANPLLVAVEVFILCFILAYLIGQSKPLAAGLSGGMSTAALSLRQVLLPAATLASAAKAIHNLINPLRNRRDLESGMQTSARRISHIAAGNTPLNPAYLQHLTRQVGRNWGNPRGGKVREQR